MTSQAKAISESNKISEMALFVCVFPKPNAGKPFEDIRSSEDIVLELLRNSRDAHSRNIFLAVSRNEDEPVLTIVDDGDGVPSSMHAKIFEPRVTSKLNTSHVDKWGYHGRGMALYSIAANSDFAGILLSEPGKGTRPSSSNSYLRVRGAKGTIKFSNVHQARRWQHCCSRSSEHHSYRL